MQTIIDIGASKGKDPHWPSDALVIGFEPDPVLFAELSQDATRKYFPVAIWEVPGTRKFYILKGRTNSSLYPPNYDIIAHFGNGNSQESKKHLEQFDIAEIREIPVDTLDNVLDRGGIKQIDCIKIDAQGATLPILKGAERTLAHVGELLVEVEFIPLYEGQPLFGEVDAWLRQRNFILMELHVTSWKRNGHSQVVYADARYVPDVTYKKSPLGGGIEEFGIRKDILSKVCRKMRKMKLRKKLSSIFHQ